MCFCKVWTLAARLLRVRESALPRPARVVVLVEPAVIAPGQVTFPPAEEEQPLAGRAEARAAWAAEAAVCAVADAPCAVVAAVCAAVDQDWTLLTAVRALLAAGWAVEAEAMPDWASVSAWVADDCAVAAAARAVASLAEPVSAPCCEVVWTELSEKVSP